MKTVLVADDEYALLSVLALALEADGHAVRCAGDGDEALAILQQGPVDLVLADSTMPGRGGLALLAEMRRSPGLAAIPFVLMLAVHEELADHGVAVLRKPFTTAGLLAAVRHALAGAEAGAVIPTRE